MSAATTPPTQQPEDVPALKDAISILRDIVVVLGGVMFFIGYIYRYTYLRSLGVPVHASQSSSNEIIIYAYVALTHSPLALLAYALALAIALALTTTSWARKRWSGSVRAWTRYVTALTFGLLLLPLGQGIANNAAEADAADVKSGKLLPAISVQFDDSAKNLVDYDILSLANKDNFLTIVDESPDSYFILERVIDPSGTPLGHAVMYRIPKSAVASGRITL